MVVSWPVDMATSWVVMMSRAPIQATRVMQPKAQKFIRGALKAMMVSALVKSL